MKHTSVKILIIAIILSFAGCGNCGHVGMSLEMPLKDTLRIDGELWYVEGRPDSGDDGTYVLGKGEFVRSPVFSFHANRSSEMVIEVKNGRIIGEQSYENSITEGISPGEICDELNKVFPYDKFPGIRDRKSGLTFKVSDVKVDSTGRILDANVTADARIPFDTVAVISEFRPLLFNLPPVTVCNVRNEYFWEFDTVYLPMPKRFHGQVRWDSAYHVLFEYADPEKPKFMGGDVQKFSDWVQERLVYDKESAEKDGQVKRVTLQFTVNEEGYLENIKVLRGVSPELDAEAVRVVSMSPQWEPSHDLQGDGLRLTYTFPVIFK